MSAEAIPIRRIFRVVNGGTPTAAEDNWGGDVPWATPVDLNSADGVLNSTQRTLTRQGALSGSSIVGSDSILISTRAPIGYVARVTAPMAFNQGCRALVPLRRVDARFFVYQLSAMTQQLQSRGMGSTFQELSGGALAEVPVNVPPLEEQRRIADFLDAETSRVDAMLHTRQLQRRAFEERELSYISATLAGFDQTGPRHLSPWPWLGKIPQSWKIGPVYAYYNVQLGKMLNPERTIGQNLRPYMRNANIHWYDVDHSDVAAMNFDPNERRRYELRSGDLLVCEGGAGVAESAVWSGDFGECYYQKSLHRVRPRTDLPVEWLMYWLRLAKHVGMLDAEGNLSTIPHLTGEQIRRMRIPVPDDASERVRSLGEMISANASVRSALDAADRLSQERRQALITAAVTGQLDVTTARSGVGA
ncbi:restriction endonuclease subunit S [Amycolatopsis dendrobii]|uniref:Restriction endonuclease subunit S n=1 Tax=Amycolatopsis dendrobii TaxID=2760662 RepID=A0A7W3ZEP7_9PSEU|nr:restriction endonuclease subunit S [Amycolatopsis dendrobii]MBB1158655.1 restriction endonuclease subunit S [Amycolatopsis dendrobii]